ncbi:helix-turn-helix domain-containing protein [Actinomadura sp. 3N407]|uniref:helix-turn-helix domain-containing protein n=1 Tax=Actinomadura sp. 3N407 TaxID=3457423 RepID=UPI003FCEA4D0
MKGLLLRLSALDADAENAVRVIGFFDGLIAGKVSPHILVRETARLAECPAGLDDDATGVSLSSEPGRASGPLVREISGTGRVWLAREGAPFPLDDIVLERFAIAAALLLEHASAPRPGDEGLVELALSAGAGEPERSRALHLMRVEPAAGLHVLAVAAGDVPIADVLAAFPGPRPRVAALGRVHAVLARSLPPAFPERLPGGVRVGVGPALPAIEAPVSWRRARTALRFTTVASPGPAVVHHDRLGALAALADLLRDEDIAEIADVVALDRLAAEPNGADILAVLTAFCATGSARKAAARVHRHHSTAAARLAYAESRLGFSFSGPGGRLRLGLAVLLRHLRDTSE